MRRDRLLRLGAVVCILLFAAYWIWDPVFTEDVTAQQLCKMLLSRLLGSLAFLFVLGYTRYRLWSVPRWAHLKIGTEAISK